MNGVDMRNVVPICHWWHSCAPVDFAQMKLADVLHRPSIFALYDLILFIRSHSLSIAINSS